VAVFSGHDIVQPPGGHRQTTGRGAESAAIGFSPGAIIDLSVLPQPRVHLMSLIRSPPHLQEVLRGNCRKIRIDVHSQIEDISMVREVPILSPQDVEALVRLAQGHCTSERVECLPHKAVLSGFAPASASLAPGKPAFTCCRRLAPSKAPSMTSRVSLIRPSAV
jgi:hypothetical protein